MEDFEKELRMPLNGEPFNPKELKDFCSFIKIVVDCGNPLPDMVTQNPRLLEEYNKFLKNEKKLKIKFKSK